MTGKIDGFIEALFALVIVLSFILFIYSRIKKITFMQALDNVINMINGGQQNGKIQQRTAFGKFGRTN